MNLFRIVFIQCGISMRLVLYIVLLSLFIPGLSQIQDNKRYTLSGTLRDEKGEILIGANIYIDALQYGTITNAYGFYSISLPAGEYLIKYSYVGFSLEETEIKLQKNITQNIDLKAKPEELEGVQTKLGEKVDLRRPKPARPGTRRARPGRTRRTRRRR